MAKVLLLRHAKTLHMSLYIVFERLGWGNVLLDKYVFKNSKVMRKVSLKLSAFRMLVGI